MTLKIQLILLLASILHLSSSQVVDETFLLPNNTKPETYIVIITTSVPSAVRRFNGAVALQLSVLQYTHDIFLHSRGHNIASFELFEATDPNNLNPVNVTFTKVNDDVIKFTAEQELQVNVSYRLDIEFTGTLSLASDGFFRSDYVVRENGTDEFT